MKKPLRILFAATMVLGLIGCNSSSSSTTVETTTTSTSIETKSTSAATEAVTEAAAETSAEKKKFSIGMAQAEIDSPFFAQLVQGVKDRCKYYGMDVDVQNGEKDPAKQIGHIQTFIAQKKDLIIVVCEQKDTLVAAVQECNKEGIPVITINRVLGDGADIVTFVGCDDYIGGQLQAQLVYQMLGEEGGNIIIAETTLGSSAQQQRHDGLIDYIAENNLPIKVVEWQGCDSDNAKVMTFVENCLTRFPEGELNAIVTHDSANAIAAAEACKAAGREELVNKIIGFDYPKSLQNAIKEGYVWGTVSQSPYLEGELGVDAAWAYLNGEAVNPEMYIELMGITPENTDQYPGDWDDLN